jgi:Fur family ferric uptake transcriptional regulator
MICDTCGDVIPFEDAGLERSIDKLSRSVDFQVAAHDVVLHGSCAGCSSERG